MAIELSNSANTAPINTILAADFGSVTTCVVLFDQVAGQFRLVSRAQALTTATPPLDDVSIGMTRAIEQLSASTGRTLLTGNKLLMNERNNRSGIDLFTATASGGRPMRGVLVGLTPDVSLASGRRALGSIYIDLVDTLSLGDDRAQEMQVNAILSQRPDLILIVGGTDNGARELMLGLLNTVKLAVSLLPLGARPVILYAGNEALHEQVKALFSDDEVQLFVAANVRPTLTEERLNGAQLELALVYGAYKSNNAGGFSDVQGMSWLGVLPTANSYANVIRYLGELSDPGTGVLFVDVGSSTVTICAALRKESYISIRPDLGLGHSAVSSVEQVGAQNVLRWLTYPATENDLLNYVWNKTLRPATVPQSPEDLEMEYALTREVIRTALSTARQSWRGVDRNAALPTMRPIIGAGAVLSQVLEPGISALLLLDALQPSGVTDLRLDPYGVIAALGGIAYLQPLALVQVLEAGGLLSLGTAICPDGKPGAANAMTVTVKYASGRTVQRTVESGGLRAIELPSGQKATVTVQCERGLTLNGRRKVTLTVEGGAAGIVFDGRGRPLVIPTDISRRKDLLPRWIAGVRAEQTTSQTNSQVAAQSAAQSATSGT